MKIVRLLGISISALALGFVPASQADYKINSGGGAFSPFAADTLYTGGNTGSTGAIIDTSGVISPAPADVYKTERYGTFYYHFTGLAANGPYKVRLHFAETYWSAAGQRKMDVKINGVLKLDDFDILATAGAKNKAVLREFDVNADATGAIKVEYVTVVDNAKSSGIELIGTTGGGGGTACGNGSGAPVDNPVTAKYGSSTYAWTSNIKWNCAYNINNYSGSTTDAKFNAARDAASANGGGIVYFPSGTYNFNDSIHLKNGVLIRGATPSSSDAKVSGYAPPAKLNFPKYNQSLSGSGTANNTAFKYISTTSVATDSNIGVVNVDINRGAIKLTATDPATQNNQNILVFGIRNNNVAEPDPGIPQSFQNAWQRWSYRFGCNIKVMGKANILIANNRVNDAITDTYDQPNYKVKDGTNIVTLASGQAQFNYGAHYGIDINRSKAGGYSLAGTPSTEPTLFRTGIVVRDNYVFHNMRIAITASGDGLVIKDNVIRDQNGKTGYVSPDGTKKVGNSNTLENRAIDWSGRNILVEGNDYEVYRHLLNGGPYYSVDGEGILIQECCGGSIVDGATIRNNRGPAATYIGIYKTRDVKNLLITVNTVNAGNVLMLANTNAANYRADNVDITSNVVNGNIDFAADASTSLGSNTIQNNTAQGSGRTIAHSCEASVAISGNSGFTVNACK